MGLKKYWKSKVEEHKQKADDKLAKQSWEAAKEVERLESREAMYKNIDRLKKLKAKQRQRKFKSVDKFLNSSKSSAPKARSSAPKARPVRSPSKKRTAKELFSGNSDPFGGSIFGGSLFSQAPKGKKRKDRLFDI